MATKKKKKLATSSKRVAKKVAKKPAAKAAKSLAKRPAAKAARKPPAKRPAKHQVVHWEIQSRAPERLHSFYADALGWEIDTNNPMRYGMVASGGPQGIDGGIGGTLGPCSHVYVYAPVPRLPVPQVRTHASRGFNLSPHSVHI